MQFYPVKILWQWVVKQTSLDADAVVFKLTPWRNGKNTPVLQHSCFRKRCHCHMWIFFIRKGRWERWVFACVVFLLVILLYFFSLLKFLDLYQNRKNQSCEKNLGQVHSGFFLLFFGLFGFFFSRLLLSQTQLPKNSTKTKKNKKNNPVRRILGQSIQDWFFWFIWFFSRFLPSQAFYDSLLTYQHLPKGAVWTLRDGV